MYSPMSTFSIVAYDPENEEYGVGVQSKFLAVGALVPFVHSQYGAIATQAKTNANYGIDGIGLLKKGLNAKEVLTELINNDDCRESRQIGVVDGLGLSCAFTGKSCLPWAGHKTGKNYSCQGNVLLGEIVIKEMAKAFERADGDLADRIVSALLAAQNAGGDRRGKQSASLLVKKKRDGLLGETDSYIDLRVDDHLSPIRELERLLELHRVLYAMNHRDKYFKFKGEVRYKLSEMLRDIGYLSVLKTSESLENVLGKFAEDENITKEPFIKNKISGEVVNKVVSMYYETELKHAKRLN